MGCTRDLFASETKFDSVPGWPSFWQPIAHAVGTSVDRSWLMVRTETHCAGCGGHLGHVFEWTSADRAAILHQRRRADLRGEAVTTQRSILLLSIGLAVVYVWLRGGFIGMTAITPAAAAQLPTMQPGWEKAVFAMGCFWSAESDFDKLNGVKFTTSGYTGGRVSNPSYEQVSRGSTGHAEAIEVAFDPAVVTYAQVLDYFWRCISIRSLRIASSVTSAVNIVLRSSFGRRRSVSPPRHRRRPWRCASASRSSCRSATRARSIPRMNRIRTITSSILHEYATIAGAVVATHDCRRSGARSSIPNAQDQFPTTPNSPRAQLPRMTNREHSLSASHGERDRTN